MKLKHFLLVCRVDVRISFRSFRFHQQKSQLDGKRVEFVELTYTLKMSWHKRWRENVSLFRFALIRLKRKKGFARIRDYFEWHFEMRLSFCQTKHKYEHKSMSFRHEIFGLWISKGFFHLKIEGTKNKWIGFGSSVEDFLGRAFNAYESHTLTIDAFYLWWVEFSLVERKIEETFDAVENDYICFGVRYLFQVHWRRLNFVQFTKRSVILEVVVVAVDAVTVNIFLIEPTWNVAHTTNANR